MPLNTSPQRYTKARYDIFHTYTIPPRLHASASIFPFIAILISSNVYKMLYFIIPRIKAC